MASAERRIILVGKIGAGKSATGNTILMRKRFPVGTRTNEFSLRYAFNKVAEVTYKVLDTPGIGTENDDKLESGYAVQRAIMSSVRNPHVFLLVFDPDDSKDITKHVNLLQRWFGASVTDHIILVFTKGTRFVTDRGFSEFLRNNERLDIVKTFGCRIIRLENHGDGRSKFRRELLKTIETTTSFGKSTFCLTPKPWYHFEQIQLEGVNDNPSIYDKPFSSRNMQRKKSSQEIPTDSEKQSQNSTLFYHGTGDCNVVDDVSFTHQHHQGAKPKVRSLIEEPPTAVAIRRRDYPSSECPRKPLRAHDVFQTIDCALQAGSCIRNIKDAPITSLHKLALIASDEENIEAVKNVVNSDEVQFLVEKTTSLVEQAATAFGKFVQNVAEEYERDRRRRELENAYKPRPY